MRRWQAVLVGGAVLTLGALASGWGVSFRDVAADLWGVALTGVLLVPVRRAFRGLRLQLSSFFLVDGLTHPLVLLLGDLLLLLGPSLWIAERFLASTHFAGQSAPLLAAGLVMAAGGAVFVEVDAGLERGRFSAASLVMLLVALGGALAARHLYAAQYPEPHALAALITLYAAARFGATLQERPGMGVVAGVTLAVALGVLAARPAPITPRAPGERLYAWVVSRLGPHRPPIHSTDIAVFLERRGPVVSGRTPDFERRFGLTQPRRVIWITIDALRADHCGFGGYNRPTTPFLDTLSESAFVFARAHSQASDSRGSILSTFMGRYPDALDFRRQRLGHPPVEESTLAEILSRKGWPTFGYPAYGREHLETIFREFSRGFAVWHMPESTGPGRIEDGLRALARDVTWAADQRGFHWLHVMEVHGPPREKNSEFGNRPVDLYDAALLHVDHTLAEFFESEMGRRLLETSLLVIHGDHGEEFGEHGGSFHGSTLYEEVLHVPLILRWPGQTVGRRVDRLVELVDVMPTVLEALGVPPSQPLQGESLLPAVLGEAGPRPFALAQLATPGGGRQVAAIDGSLKVIRDETTGRTAFFDLEQDPREEDPRALGLSQERKEELVAFLDASLAFAVRIPEAPDDHPSAPVFPTPARPQGPPPGDPPKISKNALALLARVPDLESPDSRTRRRALFSLRGEDLFRAVSLLAGRGDGFAADWAAASLLLSDLPEPMALPLLGILGQSEDPRRVPMFEWVRKRYRTVRAMDGRIVGELRRLALAHRAPPCARLTLERVAERGQDAWRLAALEALAALGPERPHTARSGEGRWSVEPTSFLAPSPTGRGTLLVLKLVGPVPASPSRLRAMNLQFENDRQRLTAIRGPKSWLLSVRLESAKTPLRIEPVEGVTLRVDPTRFVL